MVDFSNGPNLLPQNAGPCQCTGDTRPDQPGTQLAATVWRRGRLAGKIHIPAWEPPGRF